MFLLNNDESSIVFIYMSVMNRGKYCFLNKLHVLHHVNYMYINKLDFQIWGYIYKNKIKL